MSEHHHQPSRKAGQQFHVDSCTPCCILIFRANAMQLNSAEIDADTTAKMPAVDVLQGRAMAVNDYKKPALCSLFSVLCSLLCPLDHSTTTTRQDRLRHTHTHNMLKHFLLGLLASQTALSMRYVMYIDQYVHSLPSLSLIHRYRNQRLTIPDGTQRTCPAATRPKASRTP